MKCLKCQKEFSKKHSKSGKSLELDYRESDYRLCWKCRWDNNEDESYDMNDYVSVGLAK